MKSEVLTDRFYQKTCLNINFRVFSDKLKKNFYFYYGFL